MCRPTLFVTAVLLLAATVPCSAQSWVHRTVTVTNEADRAVTQMVRLAFDDLRLPGDCRKESVRLTDPECQQRVPFELDANGGALWWFVELPPGSSRHYTIHASTDADLLPVSSGALPQPQTVSGDRTAGNRSYDLTYRGPGPDFTLVLQDGVPYDPDVTQTHPQPLTEADQRWMGELWRHRVGLASLQVAGQQLVADHWPGYWTALSYYYDGRPYTLSRLDVVSATQGDLISSLVASGAAEGFAYGWGRGLRAELRVEVMPVSRARFTWVLTATHDLEIVPESGRPAQPQGRPAIAALNFLPESIAPVFDRVLWHDEAGELRRNDISTAEDRVFLSARPGGSEWCALYSTTSGALLGLVPEEWGDGGILHLASCGGSGYPRNVLQMRMVGVPAANWHAEETHVWAYSLLVTQVSSEAKAVTAMEAASASSGVAVRISVEGG